MATATGGFSGWLKSLTSSSSPTLDEEAAPRPRSDTEGRIRGMRQSVVGANEKGVKAVLCGDLGGTNSRLVLFEVESLTDSGRGVPRIKSRLAPPALARRASRHWYEDSFLSHPSEGEGGASAGAAGAELPLATRQLMLRVVGKQFPLFTHRTYKNEQFGCFSDVVHEFVRESGLVGLEIVAGCLAVAGPVENDTVNFTNRDDWMIDARALEHEFAIPPGKLRLVNDFVANGFGTVTLREGEYEDLGADHAAPVPGAPIACVGAGTGLGETFATASRANAALYEAWPSEGGHVEFAPRSQLQCELLMALREKFGGRVSTERIVSGKGIVNVYEYLASVRPDEVDAALDQRIRADDEGAAHVGAAAFDNKLCHDAMAIMMETYGAECGNAAIKFMPFGGLYIAGGIAMKNRAFLNEPDSPFQRAYRDRGRVSPLLRKVPLRLVTVEDLGLRGAHYVALTEYLGLSNHAAAEPELVPAPAAPEHDEALIEVVKGIRRALYVGSACIAAAVVISNRRK